VKGTLLQRVRAVNGDAAARGGGRSGKVF
jgi:hypothetical protein